MVKKAANILPILPPGMTLILGAILYNMRGTAGEIFI
jgi:hypothetical protein